MRNVISARPDVVFTILDGASGAVEHCEVLRALGDFPLIVGWEHAPRDLAADCLDRGADAAVPLPLSSEELVARVRAVLRRTMTPTPATGGTREVVDGLTINTDRREVRLHGSLVDLSPTEFQVLSVLAETPGKVVTNQELLTRVWGAEYADEVHYVRLYIGYLRNKLEADPHQPALLLNQWGVGYRLATPEAVALQRQSADR